MSDMLTPEDLKAIGQVVEEKVDELAETVQKGFSEMEERFNGVDRRFTSVEARLDKVETSLTTVERKLDRTDGKERAEAKPFVDAMAAKYKEQQKKTK